MPRWYTVTVIETNTHRFRVEADSPDDAKEQAEQLAVDGAWDQGASLGLDRELRVED